MKGKNWYYEINDYCKTLSEVYNVPLIKVSAIMSILSPNTTFSANVIQLEKFLKTKGKANVSFGLQREKARKVFRMRSNNYDKIMSTIGNGLKTRAFFDNIYQPDKSQLVTIDLWMVRHFKLKGSLTNKRYLGMQKNIQDQANEIGVKPHELQAHIWVTLRKKAWR